MAEILDIAKDIKKATKNSRLSKIQKANIVFWLENFEELYHELIEDKPSKEAKKWLEKWAEVLTQMIETLDNDVDVYTSLLTLFIELYSREFDVDKSKLAYETLRETQSRNLLKLDLKVENEVLSTLMYSKITAELFDVKKLVFDGNYNSVMIYREPISIKDTYLYKDYGITELDDKNEHKGEYVHWISDETYLRSPAPRHRGPLKCLRLYVKFPNA